MVNFRRHQQEWHLKQIAKKYRNNYRSYPETRVFHIKHQGLLQLPVVQWLVACRKGCKAHRPLGTGECHAHCDVRCALNHATCPHVNVPITVSQWSC